MLAKSLSYTQRRCLRIGRRATPADHQQSSPDTVASRAEAQPTITRPQKAMAELKTSYPSLDGTVLGSVVPSFRNFTTFSSEVLQLYRSFWRLVYRLPAEDQEAASAKLRRKFRQARHVRGQRHILQILKNTRAEYAHWRDLVESLEIEKIRPLAAMKAPAVLEQPKRVPFAALQTLVYDPVTKTFAAGARRKDFCERSMPLQSCLLNERTQKADTRVSAQVREFYRKKYGEAKVPAAIPAAPPQQRTKGTTALSVASNPAEYAWEDLRTITGNTLPYVRAVGSLGHLEGAKFLQPKRETLARERHVAWNKIGQRYAKGFAGFSKA